MYYSASQVHLT